MDEAEAARQAACDEEKLAAWLAVTPGAKGWQDNDGWRGTVPVDGERWIAAGPRQSPGDLIEDLKARAADASEVRVIEAEHAGCLPAAGLTARGRPSARSALTPSRSTSLLTTRPGCGRRSAPRR